MHKNLNIEFEKAVRLLTAALPVSDENSRKPVLFHGIRVGVFLYENNYSHEVVLAGVLHDALEFSSLSEKIIRTEFGDRVAELVLANTKDDGITVAEEKTKELIVRCIKCGQDALIVKTADILDSFKYYTAEKNAAQLKYCVRNAKEIFANKPIDFTDQIFDKLMLFLPQS